MTTRPDGSDWLTAREAAQLLGIHVLTLKRNTKVPYFQAGRLAHRRYRRIDIERYLMNIEVRND